MQRKTSTRFQWSKNVLCFVLAFTMVFSGMTITPKAAGTTVTTEKELIAKTNPILQSYEVSDADGLWAVTAGTRFVVEATGENIANERLAEVVKLINSEFVEKEIASSNPHTMVFGPAGSQGAADIMIRLVDVKDITSETTSEEAYKITISNLGVVVEAASETAVMYALRTIQTMMLTNNGLVYGTIVDYPDMAERRLHVDAGRKYFSKDWFIRQIREMSYLKMNALQLHFAENLGFRIECKTDPQIVSDEYLTYDDVKEILAEAEKYCVKIIPSLDTPGHVEHILKSHPEYGQVDTNGNHSTTALDITNPEAVAYIYSLYDEYMKLFEGCETFHIGADEYMEYDRYPFTSLYRPVLDAYAVEKYGAGYTWREAMAGYTNDLAAYVYSKGFKPRIFNDGVYFNEGSASQQKFPMHDYIGIDYWSRVSWIGGSPSLDTFINRGHKEIYNFNSSYFYYVLRSGTQSDGRPANSFDVKEQYKNIYNNWTPGKFSGATIADNHEVISGASLGIWCDYPDKATEDTVHTDIAKELRSLATKSWNTSSNAILSYDEFAALTEEIGNVAGYEKGSELPEVGEFSALENLGKVVIKYQNTKGNTIKADDIMYGELGTDYSFTAPAIYLWLAESDDAVTGTYSETDGEIIFVYDVDPNPVMYPSDKDTYPSVSEYVTTGGEFKLNDASRFVVISSTFTLMNEVLENDLKLLSSEFTELGLTAASMNIVYGTEETVKPGDIVIRMEEPSEDVSPEGYTIAIKDAAEVTATGEAGIFYGIRTIQKTLLLNNGVMDNGKITDAPSVDVRSLHLDAARKYFTMDWIKALIKDLSYQNINSLQFHFSENEGYRLESSTLEEKISGWHYPSDGYYTKEDMLEIIAECQKYHIELVPSLDSPGHLQYVLDQFPNPADWNCTSLWSASSDFRTPQAFNIYEKEECRQFLKDLFTEYAEFFSEAGCKHFNIGGDEFLNNFGNMTNDQYITVMNYFNEISALVKSYGMTPRAWNDGLMYSGYTGYTLDPDIEICYWSGPAEVATIEEFVANGNKVINYADVYMYYVLSSWWEANANPVGSKIFNEWTPGKLANSSRVGDQSVEQPYPEWLLGGSFAIWCDVPSYRTEDQISTNIFMRTRAMAERAWNPDSKFSYSELESVCNELGHAPGYDGSELPAPGDIFSEGTLGTVVLRYVDKDGNSLRSDRTVYGLIDAQYTITPDKLYGYRFVSMDKDATGIYTEEEIVVTLTYELYTDKAELQAAVKNAVKENDCIPGTYDAYAEALKAAKAVLADSKATQEATDAALAALTKAKAQTISLDRADLYLEVTYPVQPAGYTSASYSNYSSAVAAAKTVLTNPDATEEEVDNALANVLAKKAALTVPTDLVSVSANKGTYSEWNGTTYPLSNMLDGNPNTKAWTNEAQAVGDWFLFTFAKPVALNTFTIQFPENADCIHQADVAISADNSTWKELGKIDNTGTPQYEQTFSADGETVQYVKITITKTVDNWTQILEASFNYKLDETLDTSALEAAIDSAKALSEADYSTASWTVLEAALAKAEAVLTKEDATIGDVNSALAALEGSVKALTPATGEAEVVRLYGAGRYETGYAVADALKAALGVDKFEAAVIASGKNFPDALAGSYLAVEKNAPILLTNGKDDNIAELHAYIAANVAEGGKVYILGGEAAVPAAAEAIAGYKVVRLFGDSRYDTNLAILAEAGVTGDSIIVATGKTFADSLSASAAKLPILLVKPDGALNNDQKEILTGMKNIYIAGGEGAVSASYEAELKAFGDVTRVYGDSRYDTSVEIAKTFCKDVDFAVVASGKNFPDGLCGGPLAAALNAPLILTKDGGADAAAGYVAENGIASGFVLGGDGALTDATVVEVFSLGSAAEIK